MQNRKPMGIVLTAIYNAIGGLLLAFAGAIFAFAGGIPDTPAWIPLLGFIFLLSACLYLAATYGLWSLQTWGLNLTFWLYIIAIPLEIISIFPIFPGQKMTAGNTIVQLVGIGLSVLVIYYLSQPNVKRLFQ
ncbi:MAG: hypothetical protein NW224_26305 [Leptolyngbyaceae cyanobacterium bins.302]|nr:hypothetical protein [Leptolyngbyaceae cyanobacterium bins.302]